MDFKKTNTYLGWLVFLVATAVYFITLEDTVSLWDCGEYVTAAYKLEVGHPPGAPLFMLFGRLFSFFSDPEHVAVWINRLSAISSSATILFMFWSLTLFLKKLAVKSSGSKVLTKGASIAIFGSATIGALAYTFSESFWFSAVEGEVYAMSSLFTAAIFWAILKWDEEVEAIQDGTLSMDVSPNRWLLVIMFMLGLAIGVHLLGILIVPAISFVIYFRNKPVVNAKGIILVGILSIAILGFIQEGVIPGSISLASSFEVTFVNSLGLPFYSGTIFFFLLLTAACIFTIRWARKNSNAMAYNVTMGLIMLLIGYGSFAVIVIRSNANTPLDENDPENLVTLKSYLKREQYGSSPLLTGPHWNSKENDPSQYGEVSAYYLRRFVVSKGDQDVKAFKNESEARKFAAEVSGSVSEKYFESNATVRMHATPTYAQTTFFPRMYWSQEKNRIDGYISWSGYNPTDGAGTEIGKDGLRLPTFGENLRYFFRYQVNWMYMRYFMWNFAGRQNDIQGHGDAMRGNWISGFSSVDNARLGDQGEYAPYYTSENPAHNVFFFLPLVLGLLGLFFHFYKAPKDAFVLLLAFLFTGLAIVVYLNQKPFEPRERDYAYAGSFYFFAFWIGIGVYALYEAFVRFTKRDVTKLLTFSGALLVFFVLLDSTSDVSMPNTISWLIISAIGIGAVLLMMGLKRVVKPDSQGAIIASVLGLFVPVLMGMQGWDDHDRSLKTTARDVAYNYLESCKKGGILFTGGDNDTFPLWYLQEVEEKRTDVRVCNLSLLQTDWYTEQMKMKAYDSDPLPIKFREDQTLMYAGNTDQVLFAGLFELFMMNASENVLKQVIEMRLKNNALPAQQAITKFNTQIGAILPGLSPADPSLSANLEELKSNLIVKADSSLTDQIIRKYRTAAALFGEVQNGTIKVQEGQGDQIQSIIADFETSWSAVDLSDAMRFVRDDKNLIQYDEQQQIRIFPSSNFILKVNKSNAVKSGVITQGQQNECLNELRFEIEARGLTRDQVIMLEVLANNDWKRGIYFSSPGGSDVSVALYQRGYIKQNGLVFELSPLDNLNDRYTNQMYDNLMGVYSYGEMSNKDVLTDYYARRHTSQYRMHFASLAEFYLNRIDDQEKIKTDLAQMKTFNAPKEQIKQLEKQILTASQIAEYKKRVTKLILHSLKVMPIAHVIDMGEPNPGQERYKTAGGELQSYNDGLLHDYVAYLYRSGAKQEAEKLGLKLAEQLESVFNYIDKSHVLIAARQDNVKDFYAALSAYFRMYQGAIQYNKTGKLAARTQQRITALYKQVFPRMLSELKVAATEEGESINGSGKIPTMYRSFSEYTQAIGEYYGYLKSTRVNTQQNNKQSTGMSLEQLMNEMPVADSVKE